MTLTPAKIILILSITLSIQACSVFSTSNQAPVLNGSESAISALENWHVKGKVGVKTGNDGGSVFLQWQQNQQNFNIQLHGAFGQGALKIDGDNKAVQASSKKLGTVMAASPEELFYQQFGWEVPVSNLQFWIKGLPANTSPVVQQHRDTASGRLTYFVQDGWTVNISSYQTVNGYLLPKKITLEQPGIRVVLALSRWNFSPLANELHKNLDSGGL